MDTKPPKKRKNIKSLALSEKLDIITYCAFKQLNEAASSTTIKAIEIG
tara:strand:- start:160 stop:303 length:144 start_codon:yes stop_codon:yes gene_type:complete